MSEFYTPLKKLPNKPIPIEEVEGNIPKTHTTDPSLNRDLKNLLRLPNKTTTSNTKFNLFKQTLSKPAVYYKPVTTSVDLRFGVKPIPESKAFFGHNRRIPDTNQSNVDHEVPGDWINPYMMQALSRQNTKELFIKNIMICVMYIIGALLGERIIIRIVGNDYNVSFFCHLIIFGLIVNMVVNGSKLFQNDQCLDLPLSNRQRVLLGLKPCDVDISTPKHVYNSSLAES